VDLFFSNIKKYLKFKKLVIITNHLIHYSIFTAYLFKYTLDLKVLTLVIVLLLN